MLSYVEAAPVAARGGKGNLVVSQAGRSGRHYLAMTKTLIIGYGNPMRSDDGFGWHASRLIAKQLTGQNAQVITCHQLTPELAEPLSQCSQAVFIDADAEGEPGQINFRKVQPQPPDSSAFTHTCSPAGLLSSAAALYGHCPQAVVITVSAESLDLGESLSPVVAAALPKVVDRVIQFACLDTLQPGVHAIHEGGEE